MHDAYSDLQDAGAWLTAMMATEVKDDLRKMANGTKGANQNTRWFRSAT